MGSGSSDGMKKLEIGLVVDWMIGVVGVVKRLVHHEYSLGRRFSWCLGDSCCFVDVLTKLHKTFFLFTPLLWYHSVFGVIAAKVLI